MPAPDELSVVIIDGYVDEPAHFGVPPYMSTYPRYVAGALIDAGISPDAITYYTIDQLRDTRDRWRSITTAGLTIAIGGMTVPGNYVGGTPANADELRQIAWTADGVSLLGGPIRFGVGERNEGGMEMHRDDLDYDFVAWGDLSAAVYDLVNSGLSGFDRRLRTFEEIRRWASIGAPIVVQHPDHPRWLLCELETGRGCAYRCSFCTEPLYGRPQFRSVDAIVEEVAALADMGVRHFRLGRQADLLVYGGDGRRPNPRALEQLYTRIREAAPGLETLHLDNVNPRTIVDFPERSRTCLQTIVEHNTAGDTAAFGLESADPVVQSENNLLVSADECLEAIRMVNEVGRRRPTDDTESNLPKLLPGLNFVHGLAGERNETFEYNEQFLHEVLDQDLLVRRINIRQVMTFPNTPMAEMEATVAGEKHANFNSYKQRIRETIDQPMLERVAPAGTILRDVRMEYHDSNRTFGREIGTYPILVGLPGKYPLNEAHDVIVTEHGYRSVSGVPYPLDINVATTNELTALPGIGRNRAANIVRGRPYSTVDNLPVSVDITPFVTV